MHKPWELQGEQTEKGNEEFIIGGVLRNESRKRQPYAKKVYPLQITKLEINGGLAEKKRAEVSVHGRQEETESKLSVGKRRNAIGSRRRRRRRRRRSRSSSSSRRVDMENKQAAQREEHGGVGSGEETGRRSSSNRPRRWRGKEIMSGAI